MPPKKPPAMLTAEQIIEAPDLKDEVIDVPEWKGALRLRQLTLDQQVEAREAAMIKGDLDLTLFELHLLVRSIVEPDLSLDRIQQLGGKSGAVVRRLIRHVYAINQVDTDGGVEASVETFLG